MTERRRAPRTAQQRARQAQQSLIPGSLAGAVANASPIIPGLSSQLAMGRSVGAQFSSGSGSVLAWQDVYDLTAAGAQAHTLTYLPLPNSEHVYLNGLYQRETTDWTRTAGTTTVNVQTAMDARSGDVLAVEYLYLSDVPTPVSDGAGAPPPNDPPTTTATSGLAISSTPQSVPAGTVAGDLLVAIVAWQISEFTYADYSDWTNHGLLTASGGGATHLFRLFSKVATEADTTKTYTTTNTAGASYYYLSMMLNFGAATATFLHKAEALTSATYTPPAGDAAGGWNIVFVSKPYDPPTNGAADLTLIRQETHVELNVTAWSSPSNGPWTFGPGSTPTDSSWIHYMLRVTA